MEVTRAEYLWGGDRLSWRDVPGGTAAARSTQRASPAISADPAPVSAERGMRIARIVSGVVLLLLVERVAGGGEGD